ncbi:MAG: class I SAM-dependent methyltransferase [Woeseia sp.]
MRTAAEGAAAAESPDIETSSAAYARRFSGAAGAYFLQVQARALNYLIRDLPSPRVLDVGGGHGQLVPTLLRRNCDLTMFGSEERTHARVRAYFPHARISYGSGNLLQLPYGDRTFDIVVSVRLMAHFSAWEALLAEFCRVSRLAVIVDYPSLRSLDAVTLLPLPLKKHIEQGAQRYRYFFPAGVARELRRNGFDVERSFGQFFLPMFLHRAMSGSRALQLLEGALRTTGVTSLLGSPVLLLARRCAEQHKY